ncbi:unnamed protein product [Dovyalis caffra]|uniref:Pentatricopeptide repeat-containing protein n=1 Tax=Dovyalis caffra TaxID=77055 RepID=A0AAV1R383_9ROSI|nr:unnamed protein product [Dovyalis caffra]
MKKNGFHGTQVTYSLVVGISFHCSQSELALAAYNEMVQNALNVFQNMANQHVDSLQLFERIKTEQDCQLNEHLYNIARMSCPKLGLRDKALQLLWQVKASELPVSTASYDLAIGACEVARKPKFALEVYEHLVHQKFTPRRRHNHLFVFDKKLHLGISLG